MITIFLLLPREAYPHKNGWIFGKVPNGLWGHIVNDWHLCVKYILNIKENLQYLELVQKFICFGFTNWRCADSDDHDQDCPRCYCSGGRTTSQRQVELMMLAPPFGSIALASTERCPPQNNVNLSRINLISFLQASWYAHNWPMVMASGHAITTPKPPSHIYELYVYCKLVSQISWALIGVPPHMVLRPCL